jgi:hypothetical protein
VHADTFTQEHLRTERQKIFPQEPLDTAQKLFTHKHFFKETLHTWAFQFLFSHADDFSN